MTQDHDIITVSVTRDEAHVLDTATEDICEAVQHALEVFRFLGWEIEGHGFEADHPGVMAIQRLAAQALEVALEKDGKPVQALGDKVRHANAARLERLRQAELAVQERVEG